MLHNSIVTAPLETNQQQLKTENGSGNAVKLQTVVYGDESIYRYFWFWTLNPVKNVAWCMGPAAKHANVIFALWWGPNKAASWGSMIAIGDAPEQKMESRKKEKLKVSCVPILKREILKANVGDLEFSFLRRIHFLSTQCWLTSYIIGPLLSLPRHDKNALNLIYAVDLLETETGRFHLWILVSSSGSSQSRESIFAYFSVCRKLLPYFFSKPCTPTLK